MSGSSLCSRNTPTLKENYGIIRGFTNNLSSRFWHFKFKLIFFNKFWCINKYYLFNLKLSLYLVSSGKISKYWLLHRWKLKHVFYHIYVIISTYKNQLFNDRISLSLENCFLIDFHLIVTSRRSMQFIWFVFFGPLN